MLTSIIQFSIRNKLIVSLMIAALIGWGSYSVTQLPIDAVPDITNNQVQVLTIAPSQSAMDIERQVTFPVEQTMATIPGIEEIRSFSRFGLSVVTIVFSDDTDVYWARQQVGERLTEAKKIIPPGVGTPELAPVTTGLGEIYQYILNVKPGYEEKYSIMELRTIQDWIVRRQLLGTKGVADVSSFGGYLKQFEIALAPEKLRSLNLSISDVLTALESNNQNTGGAYIEKNSSAFFIRSEGLIKSEDDIGNIVVRTSSSGLPLLLRDVATIQLGHAIRYGAMTQNGKSETVGAVVMMLKGANSSQVITNVKERIAQIEKTLPEGVTIEPFLDRTKLVDNAIETVTQNLAEGALIVIFVLVLLLGNLRAGLVVASVIPLAMLFAIIMMNLFGVSGNLMSLGAIDFGLIVDGAVIIVEATLHYISQSAVGPRLSQQQMDVQVGASAKKMMNAAAFGQVIILIVYLPILSLVGIEGKMFKPMAQTVIFAIMGAFLLSLTYVPLASSIFLSKKTFHRKNISDRIMDGVYSLYEPTITWALRKKGIVLTISAFLLAGSLVIFSTLGGEFLPELDEGDFAVDTRLITGSNLTSTVQATLLGEEVLLKNFPEVEKVIAKIGSAEIPTDPMPIEAADMMVVMKHKSEWVSAETKDEMIRKMQETLRENVPGVWFGFQHPIQMRFNELMTGARQDVVIKVYGEDLDKLTEYAAQIGKLVSATTGTESLFLENITGLPQIIIRVKREQLARFGLSVQEVNQVINTSLAGQSAGLLFEGEKRFDIVVRLADQNRKSIEDIGHLTVATSTGLQIPLTQIADVTLEVGPNQIQRDDAKRRIVVGFNTRGRDVESIVEELRQKIETTVNFEPGYSVTYGGTFKNLQEARARLIIAVPVALILIFILLYFTFGSIKQGLLIFTAIPLSAIGGVFALWFRGMPFSISAGVGFIALFGVAVLNGIVLISEFNRLKQEGLTSITDIIMKGTLTRIRPVIMTATVASLGFLPMALSHSSGAEVQKPLATVVIGGLISATLLTLIVLPVLYYIAETILIRSIKPNTTMVIVLLTFMFSTQVHAQDQTMNVYETEKQFLNNIPAQSFELKDDPHAIALAHNKKLIIKESDQRHEFSFGELYGYSHDNNRYRAFGKKNAFQFYGYYKILDEKDMVIYSRKINHRKGGPSINYFFSTSITAPVQWLTLHELKKAYPDNPTFLKKVKPIYKANFHSLLVKDCNGEMLLNNLLRTSPKNTLMKYLISLFLTITAISPGRAQALVISLNDAVAQALEKNPTVQGAVLETTRQMALKKTSFDLPKTDVSLVYGQYNSIQKNDNNITIAQSLPFPTVFTRQNSLSKSLITSALLKEDMVRNDLTLQVKQTFNQILYLKEKHKTLLQQDSLLTDLVKAASLQYATGEGTLITKTSAETHRMEIREQLRRNDAYIQNAIRQLQLLCQSENIKDIEGDLENFIPFDPIDSVFLEKNPSLAFSKQQVELAQWQRKVEGARILPDLKIGYFSQTLIGTQNINGQDQYFGSDKRFQGFQAGMSIPIWYGVHRARIKAAALTGDVARKQEEAIQLTVLQLAQQAQRELTLNKNSLEYYRGSALPTAELLTRQSRAAFKSGVMDYTTLLLNLKQVLTIRENYVTALYQYNESVINLQYLNGNK